MRIRPFLCVLLLTSVSTPSRADNPSVLSEASVMSSVALSEATVELVASGGKLVLSAASTGAAAGSLVITAAGTGASFVVEVSAKTAKAAAELIGIGVERVAISGGWMLMLAGEALCFVPDEEARQHLHRRELAR